MAILIYTLLQESKKKRHYKYHGDERSEMWKFPLTSHAAGRHLMPFLMFLWQNCIPYFYKIILIYLTQSLSFTLFLQVVSFWKAYGGESGENENFIYFILILLYFPVINFTKSVL